MVELWKSVVGFEGAYEVSDAGNVRSLTRQVRCRGGKLRTTRGKTLRSRPINGYRVVSMSVAGKLTQRLVHRLVLEAFVGRAPEGMEACHGDGVRANNALENLRWDTRLENAKDRKVHGTDWQLHKTHCPKGHPYEGDNLVIENTGHRKCRTCKRAVDNRRYRARINEEDARLSGTKESK